MAASNKNGTIIQLEKDKPRGKCRKWKLVISLGKDPATNKYIQKAKRFSGTYSEAVEELESFCKEVESCLAENKALKLSNKAYTFAEYREVFIEIRKATGGIAPGTISREEDKLKSIGFILDDVLLKDITPLIVEQAYVDLKAGKSKSGKRLSGTYINDIHKKLSLMFNHAVKNGSMKNNPCASVEPPKIDTKEKRSIQGVKIQELLSKLNPSQHMECGVLLCTTLGLRRGEVVGLSWEDIDFEKRTIHVCHSYDDQGNLSKPKTKAGNRFLPLPDIAFEALEARQKVQLVFFEHYAPDLLERNSEGHILGIVGSAPIISDHQGNRIHPAGLGAWWYKHRASYGLEGWTLHELRHTFLTIAAEKGVHPSIMQKLAGHSTSRLTMDIYTHVNMDAQRAAMESMQEIFS